MNNILSLSKARKAKAKSEKDEKAAQNRIKFGQSKQEKNLVKAKNKKDDKHLNDHKRED